MKKFLSFIFLIFSVFLLVSCNNKTSNNDEEKYSITYNICGHGEEVSVLLDATHIPNPLPVLEAASEPPYCPPEPPEE